MVLCGRQAARPLWKSKGAMEAEKTFERHSMLLRAQ
jgi:hypothetical protein